MSKSITIKWLESTELFRSNNTFGKTFHIDGYLTKLIFYYNPKSVHGVKSCEVHIIQKSKVVTLGLVTTRKELKRLYKSIYKEKLKIIEK